MSDVMDALSVLVDNGLTDDALDAALDDLLEGYNFEDDDDLRDCIALKWSRDQGDKTGPGDISVGCGDNVVCIGGADYRVLDDDEADDAIDEHLEQLLDEPEMVPGADSPHFDREQWKNDASIDGRGHFLGSYDGEENELSIGSSDDYKWYYLYRIS